MRIVPMQEQHYDQVLAVISAAGYRYHLDREWLAFRTLDDPLAAAPWHLVALDGERVIGCCLACLVAKDDKALIKYLAVTPDDQRRGVASALLSAVEEIAVDAGRAEIGVGVGGPNFFLPGVPVDATPVVSFLEHRGYHSDRACRVNMDVDLSGESVMVDDDIAHLADSGIELRRARPEDVQACSAFALDQFSEGWSWEVAQGTRHDPCTLFVAADGDRIVGFAMCDGTGRDEFGPTGTHPDYRRKGIGSALLKMCMREIQGRGGTKMTIIWAGPIGYYARSVGAVNGDMFWQWTKRLVKEEQSSSPDQSPAD